MANHALGIDVGKTNTKIVFLDDKFNVIWRHETPSRLCSQSGLFTSLHKHVKAAESHNNIKAASIGICLPGLVDFGRQIFLRVPAVPSIQDFSAKDLSLHLALDRAALTIDNDCAAAAYGEYVAGNLKGKTNSILFSIGTGIGIGMILQGKVYRGSRGNAGEIGHSGVLGGVLKCSCSRIGCYETLMPNFNAVTNQDQGAKHFIDAIGNLLALIIDLLNIECIAFGGHAFSTDEFLAGIKDRTQHYALPENFKDCVLTKSALGKWSGAIGAALESINSQS